MDSTFIFRQVGGGGGGGIHMRPMQELELKMRGGGGGGGGGGVGGIIVGFYDINIMFISSRMLSL